MKKKGFYFIRPLRRYGYLCNDTVISSPNKLSDFQCKLANVRMVMRDKRKTEYQRLFGTHSTGLKILFPYLFKFKMKSCYNMTYLKHEQRPNCDIYHIYMN